ncbi:nucleoside/nucleotide kinase family protein [Acetobacter thailandicus]|uniref:nucleoside triphosphate hydrolase n=1 Tax=Acetobacter thailandicus TaxID=1502842 RepID=UPI001BAAC229|nr:nucleoside triphosphate hydrolase [Acetobacter thailandicus]MBS0987017.1 nucleoside triphosphate hydrolase [Acetobacter thailandicus]
MNTYLENLNPIKNRKTAVIAVVGADGSGKSTIGTYLLHKMQAETPTRLCHLGKQTGNWGRFIAKIPFVGQKADKKILIKSSTARSEKGATAFTAIIIFVLSMRRVFRFLKMRFWHSRGYTILTDRYPQTSVPGPMDGPGLVCRSPSGNFVKYLTWLEQKIYERMTSFRPDIVIRLNVDLKTAAARKPDHRYESLSRKIADVPFLNFNGAPIIDLNSTDPLELIEENSWLIVQKILNLYEK